MLNSLAQPTQNFIGTASVAHEPGLIERASGLAGGLKLLHEKMENLRDRIEGNGKTKGEVGPVSFGLSSEISEAEAALRQCHSLLDELAAKF